MFLSGDDGTDHGEFVEDTRLQREVLTDMHAEDVGRNRLKLPAIFHRRIGIDIVRVQVRWAARERYHSCGPGRPACTGSDLYTSSPISLPDRLHTCRDPYIPD